MAKTPTSKTKRPKPVKLTREQLAIFRILGANGGRTRAANLSAKARRDSARKAARARWSKTE